MDAFIARVAEHVDALFSGVGLIFAGGMASIVAFSVVLPMLHLIATEPASYDAVAGRMAALPRLYLPMMWRLQAWLGRFFQAPRSFFAFNRCLQIALLYPVGLLLLAWVFGAEPRNWPAGRCSLRACRRGSGWGWLRCFVSS